MNQHRRRTAKTNLFHHMRRLFQIAHHSQKPHLPPADELLDMAREPKRGISRRAFLKGSALLGAGGVMGFSSKPLALAQTNAGTAPRIAIVGAGIAGMAAAYLLQKAGYAATVYEAEARIGGRMFSVTGLLGEGITTELGGEFINSDHEELLSLVSEFGLSLRDRFAQEARWLQEVYFFEGRFIAPRELVNLYAPYVDRIEADVEALYEDEDEVFDEFDAMSVAEYFDTLGIDGLLRRILDVTFVAENGAELDEQSALNFLYLVPEYDAEAYEGVGESDERFWVEGGVQRIPSEIGARLTTPVQFEHRLEALRETDTAYRLSFATRGGGTLTVEADYVIVAVPFSVLRQIPLEMEMPRRMRHAIDTLGYGTNSKIIMGFDRRVWRDLGYGSYVVSDAPFQNAWDGTELQHATLGGLTLFAGGRAGLDFASSSLDEQVAVHLQDLEAMFRGITATYNQRRSQMHWASRGTALGSYSCPKPGQQGFYDFMSAPVGGVLFAGEHVAEDWAYMNSGAQSGIIAAETILEDMGEMRRVRILRRERRHHLKHLRRA